MREIREANLFGYEVVSENVATADDFERRNTTSQGNNAQAATREHTDVFAADGTAANYDGCVAGANFHLVNAAQHASERLNEGSTAIIDGVRHLQHIFHHDASGDTHVLGVRAIVKEKVFAKIFLGTTAVKAAQARRGIRGDYAKAEAPAGVYALADRGDFTDH